LIAKAV